jgi:hypothetical protein
VGFLRVLQFPPTENVDRVGWPLTDPSTVAMLRDQTYLLTYLLVIRRYFATICVDIIDILYTLDSASLLVKLKPRIFQRLPPFE